MSRTSRITVFEYFDIMEAYEDMRKNGMFKIRPTDLKTIFPKRSLMVFSRIIDVFEAVKYNCTIDEEKYSPVLIQSAKLYFMCSSAPKYIKAWRQFEHLIEQDSVKSLAHILAGKPDSWSEQQYISIHRVFSYTRDNKTNDGVKNEQLHKVASAYFDIVGRSKKTPKVPTMRTRNMRVDTDKVWRDLNIYSNAEAAQMNQCSMKTVARIKHIYTAIGDNTPISKYCAAYPHVIEAAKKYYSSANNVVNNIVSPPKTILTTSSSCNPVFPPELIELLSIENELKQLKVKETELLVKKDALIASLNTQINN